MQTVFSSLLVCLVARCLSANIPNVSEPRATALTTKIEHNDTKNQTARSALPNDRKTPSTLEPQSPTARDASDELSTSKERALSTENASNVTPTPQIGKQAEERKRPAPKNKKNVKNSKKTAKRKTGKVPAKKKKQSKKAKQKKKPNKKCVDRRGRVVELEDNGMEEIENARTPRKQGDKQAKVNKKKVNKRCPTRRNQKKEKKQKAGKKRKSSKKKARDDSEEEAR